jgi:hypothetical protein
VDVYLLWHMRPLGGRQGLDPEQDYIETDDKLCGVFSTEASAEEARQQLVKQPGFKEFPEDFYVGEYELDKIQWADGFVTVQVDEKQP